MKNKICKFFLKGKCDHGASCEFIHDNTVCRNYFFDGKCKKGVSCKFKHDQTLGKKRVKNTENLL